MTNTITQETTQMKERNNQNERKVLRAGWKIIIGKNEKTNPKFCK